MTLLFITFFAVCLSDCACDNNTDFRTYPDMAGSFELVDHDNRVFTEENLKGKISLLFFGYTACPDVCPMTLSKIKRSMDIIQLPPDKIQVLFVSVDPRRDTPDKLRSYLDYYNLGARGLTGSVKQINHTTEIYKAYYQKVESDSAMGYVIEHTVYLYLLDPEGQVRHLFHNGDKPEFIAKILKRAVEKWSAHG